ncbi:protein kinase [Streptacidiphilus sp. MAP5-3]|uniref:protein kinase domain-containing protein n=1 Tax=unclassified Streptacidiphilus TaxID=2643834 RepID=UPI003510D930
MLRALSRAHAAGIIHRDLKPDNVLLVDDRVVITDFGIAHMVDSTMALTHTGTLIGTPAYMAPEQLSGQPPTPATDLWSLGATLYCAVEGEPPFSAETFTALCIAVVTGMPRPALRAEGLGAVLTALLTKDPARRVGAAQALAALEEVARTGGAAYVPTHVDSQPPAPAPAQAPALAPGFAPAGPGVLPVGAPAPWGGGPSPRPALPKARANSVAAMIAGSTALLTAAMLVWFGVYNFLGAHWAADAGFSPALENVAFGLLGGGVLLVPAGFAFARRIAGAWTLCALCVLYILAILLVAPLQGEDFGAHLQFVFGFDGGAGVANGLAIIFSTLTAISAAIAGSVKSSGPTTATPPRP